MTRRPAAYRGGARRGHMGWRVRGGAVWHWRITGMDMGQSDAYPGVNGAAFFEILV